MIRSGALGALELQLERCSPVRWEGRVLRVTGNLGESEGPYGSVGEECELAGSDGRLFGGEIIGFRDRTIFSMTTEAPVGIRPGDCIRANGRRASVLVGLEMLGRVLNARGEP